MALFLGKDPGKISLLSKGWHGPTPVENPNYNGFWGEGAKSPKGCDIPAQGKTLGIRHHLCPSPERATHVTPFQG